LQGFVSADPDVLKIQASPRRSDVYYTMYLASPDNDDTFQRDEIVRDEVASDRQLSRRRLRMRASR